MNYKYLLTSMLAVAGISAAVSAQNPIISAVYTPDPAPYVHGDKLYLLPTMMRMTPPISL